MADGITKAIPTPARAELANAGRTIDIYPIKMRQIAPLTAAMRPISGAFTDTDVARLTSDDWLGIIASSGADVFPVVSIVSGLTVEEIGELTPADFVELVTVIVEVNTDFFLRSLAPKLTGVIARIRTLTGLTYSKP